MSTGSSARSDEKRGISLRAECQFDIRITLINGRHVARVLFFGNMDPRMRQSQRFRTLFLSYSFRSRTAITFKFDYSEKESQERRVFWSGLHGVVMDEGLGPASTPRGLLALNGSSTLASTPTPTHTFPRS